MNDPGNRLCTQWAAVSIHRGVTMTPPQWWWSLRRTDTVHGNSPSYVSLPPTTFEFLRMCCFPHEPKADAVIVGDVGGEGGGGGAEPLSTDLTVMTVTNPITIRDFKLFNDTKLLSDKPSSRHWRRNIVKVKLWERWWWWWRLVMTNYYTSS